MAVALARRKRARLDAERNSARQHAHTLREWSARTKSIQKITLCARSSFMLGEVTAPKCYHQATVFHELKPRKIELLQDVFVQSLGFENTISFIFFLYIMFSQF